jgi:hypothetical protein
MQILGVRTLRSLCTCVLLAIPTTAFGGGATPPGSPNPKPDHKTRVWTNEDVEALGPRFEPTAGTAQTTRPGEVSVSQAPAPLPAERDAQWYAQQLATVAEELASVSDEASELQHFRRNTTGLPTGLNIVAPCEGLTLDNLIALLESRRQELLEQIDALSDVARANGMPPGILVQGRGLVSAETPLTKQEQDQTLTEQYDSLLGQLDDTRQTIAAMHAEVASQGATLLPSDPQWGGNMTTNLLQDLHGQQAAIESEIRATEDEMLRAGLSVR